MGFAKAYQWTNLYTYPDLPVELDEPSYALLDYEDFSIPEVEESSPVGRNNYFVPSYPPSRPTSQSPVKTMSFERKFIVKSSPKDMRVLMGQ